MAWFLNKYRCDGCGREWKDAWSAMCDDDCPYCGSRHMSPYDSVDLTEFVEESGGRFLVFRSPATAQSAPDYELIAECPTLPAAEAVLEDTDD